jgi:hypothetical protein
MNTLKTNNNVNNPLQRRGLFEYQNGYNFFFKPFSFGEGLG